MAIEQNEACNPIGTVIGGNIDALARLGCQTIAHRCGVTRREPGRIGAIAELLSVVRDILQGWRGNAPMRLCHP